MNAQEMMKLHDRAIACLVLIDSLNSSEFDKGVFKKAYANTMIRLTQSALEKAIPELKNNARPVADIEVKADGTMHIVQIAEQAFA